MITTLKFKVSATKQPRLRNVMPDEFTKQTETIFPMKIAKSCTRSLKNKILIRHMPMRRLIEIRHQKGLNMLLSLKIEKFFFPIDPLHSIKNFNEEKEERGKLFNAAKKCFCLTFTSKVFPIYKHFTLQSQPKIECVHSFGCFQSN